MPALGNLCPVAILRCAFQWEFVERFLDVCEGDSDTLGGANEGDSPEHIPVEASLVPFISGTEDETFAFVKMKRRNSDTTSLCNLTDRELIRRVEGLLHHRTIVLDLNFG